MREDDAVSVLSEAEPTGRGKAACSQPENKAGGAGTCPRTCPVRAGNGTSQTNQPHAPPPHPGWLGELAEYRK